MIKTDLKPGELSSRTELLLGRAGVEKLKNSRVAVFGVGGVGGYTVEALARCGVGAIDVIDNDVVSLSNINRQIIATHDTIGMLKVEACEKRIKSINPDCRVVKHNCFFLPDNANDFDFSEYDYVVDAVDTVRAKLALVQICKDNNVNIISSMGAGNKLDPTRFEVADISKTSVCPLAKVMRTQLRKIGINHLKVVYSKEPAVKINNTDAANEDLSSVRKSIPGSVSFVPSVAGLIIAGEVVKDLCSFN